MALITCKECKNKISDTAKVCPHCGYEKKDFAQSLDDIGKAGQNLGCALTIFITIPILLFLFMVGC